MARSFTTTSSQYLSYGASVLGASGTPPYTIALWFKPTSGTAGRSLVAMADTAVTNVYTALSYDDLANTFLAATRGSGGLNYATKAVPAEAVWVHGCGVFASTSSRIAYVNGVAGTENTVTTTMSGLDNTTIGALVRTSVAGYMDGSMAEVAVWSAALSGAEVAALADGVSPLMVRPGELLSYWPLMGRTSPEIDLIGGAHMTLNGSPPQDAHPPMRYPGRVQAWTYGAAAPAGLAAHPFFGGGAAANPIWGYA